jgi:hypothetical protein
MPYITSLTNKVRATAPTLPDDVVKPYHDCYEMGSRWNRGYDNPIRRRSQTFGAATRVPQVRT